MTGQQIHEVSIQLVSLVVRETIKSIVINIMIFKLVSIQLVSLVVREKGINVLTLASAPKQILSFHSISFSSS